MLVTCNSVVDSLFIYSPYSLFHSVYEYATSRFEISNPMTADIDPMILHDPWQSAEPNWRQAERKGRTPRTSFPSLASGDGTD
jgi:hypothetical protein